MPIGAAVPYNPIQGVTEAQGVANDRITTQATPADFGAQKGEAEQQLGGQIQDTALMYAQRATEASANDKIVNQWAPTATALAQDYYSKQGKDAVAGFDPYMQGLQQQRDQLLQNSSPAEKQILNQYITRHIAQEYDGAMRHQVQQMDVYENQQSDAFVNLQAQNAVAAGSNPDMIKTAMDSGAARIQVHGIDRGQSPDVVQQQQNDFIGKTSTEVVKSAVLRGDIGFANTFYANNKDNIPGVNQVEIENTLHAENQKYTDKNNVDAIINGQPLPPPSAGGMPVVQVKSAVAGAAQAAGVDPSASLMIAGVESSFGQNVGKRGDIGQTGKPAANIQEQAQHLVQEQQTAQAAADAAVGGKAENWQMYTVYQQGVGGGVAMLKALQTNPNASAVQTVAPYYKNPQEALQAIQENGGNSTMTVQQFTDLLKTKCNNVYGQVKCNTVDTNGNQIDLSKALVQPHQDKGVVNQPTTNPIQALIQFEQNLPTYYERANGLATVESQKGALEGLEAKRTQLKQQADAYKDSQTQTLREVTSQSDFISVNDPRLTPQMRSFMSQDQSAYDAVYRQAERNRNVAKGTNGSDAKYGSGFSYLQQEAYAGKLNQSDMFYHLGDDLSQEGFDKLKSIVKPTVGGGDQSDNDSMATFLKYGHERILHSDLFQNTPDAEKSYQAWFSSVSKTIQDKQKDGVPLASMLDPHSKDYVGGSVGQYLVPIQKQLDDRAQKINAGLQTLPALSQDQMRQPGETPEAYLARMK
jgi:hypothetical protein